MSHTPVGGHPQGWEHKLADRSSLPPAAGEEKSRSHQRHVFTQPLPPKSGAGGVAWRSETSGSEASSARSSPPYMRWARSLHSLLEDAEGVRLFRKFVVGAGGLHVDRLNFYFAVQGLRQETDPNKIRQVVSAIYKFLRKCQLAMPEDLKQLVKQSLKDGSHIEKTIFDEMEKEVTKSITETTYQAFLHSEAYVSYVSAATQPLSSAEASPPAPAVSAAPPPPQYGLVKEPSIGLLATLHEGEELEGCPGGAGGGAGGVGVSTPARLTHDALLATQTRRLHSEVAPARPRQRSVYAAHLTYGGYCPASRVDSRASLSSLSTDSDAVSMSSASLDGLSRRGGVGSAGGAARAARGERARPRDKLRDCLINRELEANATVIPRTQRVQSEQLRVLPPSEFAPILIEKLERVRREQETKERLERRLQEGEGEEGGCGALPPALVAAAIREKLQLDTDNDQDILDQHVSRVWSERTPGGSPGSRRRRRRPPSTLSADSGHGSDRRHPMSYRSSSKKTAPSTITDSGVSVVSSAGGGAGGAGGGVEPRVLMWMCDAERGRRPAAQAERGSSSSKNSMAGSSGGDGGAGGAGGAAGGACTVVVVSFLDELVPYRIKVPAAPLTLKLFKDYLPRKGNYRYFFKTECADLDNTVIQEEVSSDSDVLPMYDGKVMARVKSIE